jgi:hypothetical protein
MTATGGHEEPSEKDPAKGENRKKESEQPRPRKQRRRTYQMAAVAVAKETDILPEPIRSGVVTLAQAIIGFFQRAWQELTGSGAADHALRLLPPGSRDPQEDD